MTTPPREFRTEEIRAGLEIHGYLLRERLGTGGFGEVWLAENLDRETFALKLGRRVCPTALEALRRELDVFRRLRRDMADARPPIVGLKHNLLNADPPALVMEYVSGGDLRAFARRRGSGYPASPAEADAIMRDILDALAFVHDRGVSHRDLSPENVLYHEGERRWKVADFGLGAIAETELSFLRTGRSKQLSGSVAGKLDYMAPERRAGGEAGPAADLYAAGVIWAWLMAGSAHLLGLPANWSFQIPAARVPILTRCLEADPKKRWPSARALREALDEACPPDAEEPQMPSGAVSTGRRVVAPETPSAALRVAGRREVARWRVLDKGKATRAAFTRDGRALIGAKSGRVLLWRIDQADAVEELPGHRGPIRAASFSEDGRLALTASGGSVLWGGRSIRLWDADTHREAGRLESADRRPASCLGFASDGRRAFSGRADGALEYWDLATGGVIHAEDLFEKLGSRDFYRIREPLAMACSAREKSVLVAGNAFHLESGRGFAKGIVAVHCLEDWRHLRHYFIQHPFAAAALSTDGRRVFGGHADNAVSFVELGFDEAISARVKLHTGPVVCAALSLDGRRALSGSRDKTVRLWDFEERREIACCAGHNSTPVAAAFLEDGRAISCAEDGEVILWSLP
jgi:hypothetical protein